MATRAAQLPRYVELREISNLEEVLDIPALHLAELRRIAGPGRKYGVHVAAELGDAARIALPEVMRLPNIDALWRELAARIEKLASFYRGHPDFHGWPEDAARAIRDAIT